MSRKEIIVQQEEGEGQKNAGINIETKDMETKKSTLSMMEKVLLKLRRDKHRADGMEP